MWPSARFGACCLLTFSIAASASPMLRLSNSVIVAYTPLHANAASQTIDANNIGDGTLSLTVSVPSGITWLSTSVFGVQTCVETGTPCNPIQFTFKTGSLAAGNYSASVTLSDPNAVDTPQVVIVSLQVGVAPINEYMAPGSQISVPIPGVSGICFSNCVSMTPTTSDGSGWLKASLSSEGTIYFDSPVALVPVPTMAPGTYTGNVAIGPPVNENIPVTMHLTTLPIAVPSTNQIALQLAQNGPPITYPFLNISLSNSGMGTLQITGVSASGTGMSAYNDQGVPIVTVDPGSFAPGTYTDGQVTIQCNAANCPLQIPVNLEIDPPGPPIIIYQRAVDNAKFMPSGSPGDVMIVQGTQLSLQPPQYAAGAPLPTTLGGASVLVNGVATPLYYSSYGQIAFQVRNDTYLGTAVVQVVRDDQYGNTVSTNMQPFNPGIVVVTDTSYNVVDANHPATAGETLVFWALGLSPTTPVVADGTAAPANPPANVTVPITVAFGGGETNPQYPTTPSFAGLSPGSVGLYQVIATLPTAVPKGTASAFLLLPNNQASNTVTIAVQ